MWINHNRQLTSVTIVAGAAVIGEDVFAANQVNPADLTISGASGSTAESYANTNGHSFVIYTPAYLYGDVDDSGQVDVNDINLVLRHVVALTNIGIAYGPFALIRAKVSVNLGAVDVGEAILILRRIAGLIPEFPVEGGP